MILWDITPRGHARWFTVVIQAQSMEAATYIVAPTLTPFNFGGSKCFWMLGWCGLNPKQEILITPVWNQLKAETTKTVKNPALIHILDPSNVGDEEVNIFLRKIWSPTSRPKTLGSDIPHPMGHQTTGSR